MDILQQCAIDLGIYGLFVIIYTLVGAYQNISLWGMKWDWKKWADGLFHYVLLGVITLGTVFGAHLLLAEAEAQGVILVDSDAVSPKVITTVIIISCATMLGKIVKKLSTTFGLTEKQLQDLQKEAIEKGQDEDWEIVIPEWASNPQCESDLEGEEYDG